MIDWEFSHFGSPAQDLGHLGAHLWMQAHRSPDAARAVRILDMLRTCLAAYREAVAPRRGELLGGGVREDCRIHLGCEVLARTVGAFRVGSLYETLPDGDPALTEAVALGVDAVLGRGEDLLAELDGGTGA